MSLELLCFKMPVSGENFLHRFVTNVDSAKLLSDSVSNVFTEDHHEKAEDFYTYIVEKGFSSKNT